MDNLDPLVLRTLRDWRRSVRQAMLFTVVRTWGASPLPVGALMALARDGAVVGSVSGGCIEDDLLDRYAGADKTWQLPGDPASRYLRCGVSADEAHRFGLPCGGTSRPSRASGIARCTPQVGAGTFIQANAECKK